MLTNPLISFSFVFSSWCCPGSNLSGTCQNMQTREFEQPLPQNSREKTTTITVGSGRINIDRNQSCACAAHPLFLHARQPLHFPDNPLPNSRGLSWSSRGNPRTGATCNERRVRRERGSVPCIYAPLLFRYVASCNRARTMFRRESLLDGGVCVGYGYLRLGCRGI